MQWGNSGILPCNIVSPPASAPCIISSSMIVADCVLIVSFSLANVNEVSNVSVSDSPPVYTNLPKTPGMNVRELGVMDDKE